MIITIKGADFSSANIGTLSTYIISKSIGRGASFDIPSFVEKNSSVNWVITLGEDYSFGTYSVTMGGEVVTPTINGSEMTIAIANVTGNIRITIATVYNGVEELPEPDEPEIPDTPTPDEPEIPDVPSSQSITWEIGALDGSNGGNSATNMKTRLRTKNYLEIADTLTVSVIGDAEMCPIYYKESGAMYSPNAYQTESFTVSRDEYYRIRVMIRDKNNPNRELTTDFGSNLVVVGEFTEVSFVPEKDNIPAISENVAWSVGAVNSSTGEIDSTYKTRIYSTRTRLDEQELTISVTGNAEMCPIWYNSDGSLKSSPAAYQTDPIVTTKEDGHSIAIMARDKTDINKNLTPDFGQNIIFNKQ